MTDISKNPIHKPLTKSDKHEIAEIMTSILNISKKEILESIKLFSGINPDMQSCLYKLHKIQKKDYTTALMLLEYLLVFGSKSSIELIKT